MTNFSMGGNKGEKWPKARSIPDGAVMRIADASVKQSSFMQKIEKGPNAGKEIPRQQLLVVYEALSPGTTVAYTSQGKSYPAVPYPIGQKFVQYLGGVYLQDGGNYKFSDGGGAAAFISALKELGVEPTGKLEDYVDLNVAIKQVQVRAPGGGTSSQAMPASIIEDAAATAPVQVNGTAPAPAPVVAAAPAKTASAPTNGTDAFAALKESDRKLIADALKTGTVEPADLVEALIAKDTKHAEAILAAAPKRNPLRKA